MTAIVTFNSSYGRQILNWFSLTPPQLEQLTEPGPLRRAFVMFLISFFVDGKVSIFRPLLEKKGKLIFPISFPLNNNLNFQAISAP